jgi:hypothetical protein
MFEQLQRMFGALREGAVHARSHALWRIEPGDVGSWSEPIYRRVPGQERFDAASYGLRVPDEESRMPQ